MPAAMHLTALLSLLTVTVCSETTVFSGTKVDMVTTTSASHATLILAASSAVKTTSVTPQSNTAAKITTEVISTLPQTPTAVEKTNPTSTLLNTTTSQTSDLTVSQNQTAPPTSDSLNVTAGVVRNTTSPALSNNKGNNYLAENPGLVATICIFCIVLGLFLVVMAVKCLRSSRSNFERLEDMPLGKVNEASPFAQYSK